MKKKICIFLAINLAIATLAAFAPPSLTNGSGYLRHAVVHDFIESAEPGSHLSVILGDSRSDCCIAAEQIGFTNLSYQGASPVEGYFLLGRLLDRGVNVDRLILSYGPFHIFTQDTFHSQSRYFGLIDQDYLGSVLQLAVELEDEEYLEYHWRALEVLDENMPWMPDALKFRVVNVLSIHETIKSVWRQLRLRMSGSAAAVADITEMRDRLYVSSAPDRVNRFTESPESRKPNAVSPVNEVYLRKLTSIARTNGIDTYFLVMPFNEDVEHPPEEYYERYFGILEDAGLGECYGSAIWWPNQMFADAHHLNVQGAERFGARLHHHLGFCHW